MNTLRVSALLENCNSLNHYGSSDPIISQISYDSRHSGPGSMFFAIPGVHSDGHDFIPQAIRQGALAIVHSRPLKDVLASIEMTLSGFKPDSLTFIQVADVKHAMAQASSVFWGNPQNKLRLIGVTGTDGKSTTVSLIHQLLEKQGEKAGFISTVAMAIDSDLQDNTLRQSTPESPEIHSLLQAMEVAGCRHAVIEATSHGLSEKTQRLHGIGFQTGVFTNISHEHLEFHGSFDQYLSDKANLFRKLQPAHPSIQTGYPTIPAAVINAQSPHATYLAAAAGESGCSPRVYFYGIPRLIPRRNSSLPLTLWAEDIHFSGETTECTLYYRESQEYDQRTVQESTSNLKSPKSQRITIPLPGEFMVENIMAAVLAVHSHLDIPIARIVEDIGELEGVKGRMRSIQEGQDFSVIVDYAHTPGSFETVFPMFRQATAGRLIALFGSGGERDVAKRSVQGEIAARYADVLFLTNEDPRLENPEKILSDIFEGAEKLRLNGGRVKEIHRITDRKSAISAAFNEAKPGDLVVLLGKGHEASIITIEGKIPWDEEEVARNILKKMGRR